MKIAIFISGEGSNMRKIVEASKSEMIDGEVVGVFSSDSSSSGLEWAKEEGIKTFCLEYDELSQEEVEKQVSEKMKEWGVELIALAGFMKVLTSEFVKEWKDSIINVHPSLLPEYKGLDTHLRVLKDGQEYHGSSVHVVTEDLDGGNIIAQEKLLIDEADDKETLKERVKKIEHEMFPKVIGSICNGKIKIKDGEVCHNEVKKEIK